ncbi:MAG: prepilin-type N-terminal cleavage/methylation domain-containing protein [Candidatus Zixiibacteriota bacterium]
MNCLKDNNGFSLIELTIVIIIIGIMLSLAIKSMTALIKDTRQIKTERELEMLTYAIVGDPSLTSAGARSDFGYVGDVGAFPSNLDALAQNPGGYATWDGPYIEKGFTQDVDGFKTDEWGKAYNYSGGITITSTGSGSTITKKIADATSDYLLNTFNGTIQDINDSLPGSIYKDSINIKITIPDGSGSSITKIYNPDSIGVFTLDSLPAGQHPLRIIYVPNVDTLFSYLNILPRHKSSRIYKFASSYFTGGGGGGGGGGSSSEILRPMGVGSSTQLLDENCTGDWSCVDEVTSDGDGTFVKGAGGSWDNDTYATENSSVSSGTIDSVVVFIRAKFFRARTAIRTNGTLYEGNDIWLTNSYANYSTSYITNPNTSSAWTWTEIDALEIGVTLKESAFCTQVWVEVYYTN